MIWRAGICFAESPALFIAEGDIYDEQPDGEADDKDLEDAGDGEPGKIEGLGNWRIHIISDVAASLERAIQLGDCFRLTPSQHLHRRAVRFATLAPARSAGMTSYGIAYRVPFPVSREYVPVEVGKVSRRDFM